MKTFLSICKFFIFSFFTLPVLSQTYFFRNYSVEHGLPFIQVSTIYQDSKGYLWSGGYGGLSRFDGMNFVNYNPRKGLSDHFVTAITGDPKGNLWVGTANGLNRFDGKHFTIYTTKENLPDNSISTLLYDRKGNLWVGTGRGLSRYDGERFSNYSAENGLPGNAIKSLYEDSGQNMWIGTDKGIAKYTNGRFETISFGLSGCDSMITSIAEDAQRNIWVGSANGVYMIRTSSLHAIHTGNQPITGVTAILKNQRDEIWIGTPGGLYHYNGYSFSKIPVGRDNNSNSVYSLFIDSENNLWLGTFNGLFRYRQNDFTSFTEKDGVHNNFIFQILRDSKNRLWVCANNGVYDYDRKKFRFWSDKYGFSQHNLACAEDKEGNLWFGTNNGLVKYDGKNFSKYTTKDGLVSNYILSLMTDKKGRLWIGGRGGLTLFNGKSFLPLPYEKQYSASDAQSLYEDSDGSIWIGNYQGKIFRYINNRFEEYGSKLGIKSSSCMSIIKDKEGYMYFGTFDGVFIYDGKKVQVINIENGLSSDLVYAMVFDREEKNLWVGTNQGVNKIDIDDFKKNGKPGVDSYGKEDGFIGVESNGNGIFMDKDQSLWFGTVNGLIRFEPDKYEINKKESKTHITNVRIFYSDTTLAQQATLPHYLNNITFEFIGICFSNPQKVKYKYRLDGYDKQWSPVTNNRIARYSNLSPGTYKFNVISCNNENIWNASPVSFSFSIKAPFYKTWWFWLTVFFASLALTIYGMRLRIQQVELKAARELEQKTEISKYEMKALRAQMNPHFIFNSLNSIQSFIMNHDESSATKYLNTFARLIRNILYSSEKQSVTIREELETVRLYLELEKLRFEDKFEYSIEVNPLVDIDSYDIPTMLIQPYAENSILHGLVPKKEKGKLDIRISMETSFIVCRITDNGIGRKKAGEIKKSAKREHISFGTKITKTRLELINTIHKSRLNVTVTDLYSGKDIPAGTMVEIFIPIA